MIRLSLDSVTGFSTAPLRAATWLGLAGGLAALALIVYAVIAMASGDTLPGWTSTVVIVAGVGAVQLLCLGILGEYVGRMYAHLQARPTYFVAYDSTQEGTVSTGPFTEASAQDVTPAAAPVPAESPRA
jgi:dolichol-phosphate mannosyltransferase